MPVSDRAILLNEIEEAMKFAVFQTLIEDSEDEDEDEDEGGDVDESDEPMFWRLGKLHCMIGLERYLSPRGKIPKSQDYVYNYFLAQSNTEFRTITRVWKDAFHFIVGLIEEHPVFQNNSRNPQAPVHWQLACALDRLGNDGSGVSVARSKLLWGLGHGTVLLYTKRVVKALNDLRDIYLCWPDALERNRISQRMAQKGFPGCVGFVDGTVFPLHKRPAVDGEVFLDRKKTYSVNAQVVCDDRNIITAFYTGWPGSCADALVYSKMSLCLEAEEAFSEGEFLLADAGYRTTKTVVSQYRSNQRDFPDDPNEIEDITQFGTYLAKSRVVNEHTIGMLKGRFRCLKGMRIDIHKREDMVGLCQVASACAVLHNILVASDPWEEEEMPEGPQIWENAERHNELAAELNEAGNRQRYLVRQTCLDFHRSNPL